VRLFTNDIVQAEACNPRVPVKSSRRFWTPFITSLPPSGYAHGSQAIVRNTCTSPGPREVRLIPALRMETTPPHTQTKPSTRHNNPRKTKQETAGYYEPTTMILDHLAISHRLSARAVEALGGHSKTFSDDLSLRDNREPHSSRSDDRHDPKKTN
jgi:hypothetical protein